MNIVKKIGVSGIAGFKPSVLNIAEGITYLYGLNLLTNNGGNAAGKSVLVSSTADIFYDTPMVGERADKAKTGNRFVVFDRKGQTVKIGTTYQGKTEKLNISVDGESKTARTQKLTKELARKLWPLNEEEYRTYGYLDVKVPHPLVMGTSAMRKAFFTSFFQLDRLDAERKVLFNRMKQLNEIKTQYTELETTFVAVKSDMLTKDQRLELEAKVTKLERRVKALRQGANEARRVQSLLDFEKFAGKKLDQLKGRDLDDLESEVKQLKRRIAKANENLEQLQEYRAYLKQKAQYEADTKGLDMTQSLDDLEKASERFMEATAVLKSLEHVVDPKLGRPKIKPVEKPEQSKDYLIELRAKIRHQSEHAEKFSKGVCGECGQSVALPNPKRLKRMEQECEELGLAWKLYDRYNDDKEQLDRELAEYKPKQEQREKAQRTQDKLREQHVLFKTRKKFVPPVKVEKPAKAEDPRPLEAELELLQFGLEHRDTIREVQQLTKEQRSLQFDGSALDSLQDRVSSMRTKLEVHNTVKGRASTMRTRLAELKAELADEEALALILKGYADKAVKKMAVEAISERMMATVNELSGLVFNDYHFEFKWDTQIRLLVHRGKKGVTDVRKLSGAESMLFTLILVFSLLMFVPKDKRLSLLVLDEPCASFHENTIVQFHTLLPHLLQLIPSILVVSPKRYERYDGAHEYTVIRDDSGAYLKTGHPSDFR